MATVTLSPARLKGTALVPPSKSEVHRALLLAAFGRQPCRLHGFPEPPAPLCDDICAMVNGITALGANVHRDGTQLVVQPIPQNRPVAPMVTCRISACAAALRMLIPAFLAQEQPVRFEMAEGLFRRPLDAFAPLMERLAARMQRIPPNRLELEGRLAAGDYTIDGSLSSQFASGMLLSLCRLAPSTLRVTGPIVSRPYLDMTIGMMRRFGCSVTEETEGVFALSPRRAPEPADADIAGDWSQAAVLMCMNALGSQICISNLPKSSLQGDARVVEVLLRRTSVLRGIDIDCSDIPDLVPMLALVCALAQGTSTLSGVERLRHKESDRLSATGAILQQLGVRTEVNGDALTVYGVSQLRGGFTADARQDHRLVMMLSAAALVADAPITVSGAECIAKSWPTFWDTYRQLGGIVK